MTNSFNLNVNLDKVSKAVKQFVSNVAKMDGSKRKIDSDKEFNELSQYLSGNSQTMNKDEIGYIQGFMFEYQNKKAKEFEENEVTDNTKKEVSKIAKRMGDKKVIDSDEEAQALATMLKNTHNDLNAADIAYIKNLLLVSGYANYLQEEEKSITVINIQVTPPEQTEEKGVSAGTEQTANSTEAVKNYQKPALPKKNNVPRKETDKATKEADRAEDEANRASREADRSKAEADRSAQEAERSKKEADRSRKEADRAKKEADSIKKAPKVAEAARAQGFGIANKIQEELHDFWTNDGTVEKALNRVNSSNAYSFVGKMLEVSDKNNVFGGFYKRVSASSVCHAVLSLLNQARSIGLDKDNSYKTLEETYKFLKRLYVDKEPNAPIYDSRDVDQLDIQIKHLYKKMSAVYK